MAMEFIFGSDHPEKDRADFVVCRGTVPFDELPDELKDNIEGPCSGRCGKTLMWRPESPDKPKLCMACAAQKIMESAAAAAKEDSDALMHEGMAELCAKVGLTRTPEAISYVLGLSPSSSIPQPGDAAHDAFREGTSFAMSLIFAVFHAEQTKGALVDLCERHSNAIGVMIWLADQAVENALGVAEFAEVEPAPEAVE